MGSYHRIEELPALPCSRCYSTIAIDGKTKRFLSDPELYWHVEVGALENYDLRGLFHAEMKCANTHCRQRIIMIAEFTNSEDSLRIDSWGRGLMIHELRPLGFFPPIPVIRLPEHSPKSVRTALLRAFSHVFSDPSAAGNALRSSIERILDHWRVPRTFLKNGKRKPLWLDQRIRKWSSRFPELAEHLLAVKWIGNKASHEKCISLDDVFDGFEVIEQVINRLYSKDEKRIAKIVRRVNKRKKR